MLLGLSLSVALCKSGEIRIACSYHGVPHLLLRFESNGP